MRLRKWLGTGMIEAFDKRQQSLLDHILKTIRHYYTELYETRERYRYPLTAARLSKLSKRSGLRTMMAVRILANSIDIEFETQPPIACQRARSRGNQSHRPYQIFILSSSAKRQK